MSDQFLKRLTVENFTAFKSASFEFVSGINVFVGENGTGKTHLLKLLYSMLKPFEAMQPTSNGSAVDAKARFNNKLAAVFRPDDDHAARLISSTNRVHGSRVHVVYNKKLSVSFTITPAGKVHPRRRDARPTPHSVYIPTRDVLAWYEGFASAYEERELAFDETYYDLCKALAASPLKGERKERANRLLAEFGRLIGGKLKRRGGRFYLEQSGRREVEAQLLAEGLRKIATLYRLIANGSLTPGTILFLDEPEASLNPKLVTPLVTLMRAIAAWGVQVFISTHDFLLSQELSLAAEYETLPQVSTRFFAMTRGPQDDVSVQGASLLSELRDNAILEEFAAHYDREQSLFAESKS